MNIEGSNKMFSKTFSSKMKYNNNDNKYELKQYEIEIEKQIISRLIEKVIIFFSEI